MHSHTRVHTAPRTALSPAPCQVPTSHCWGGGKWVLLETGASSCERREVAGGSGPGPGLPTQSPGPPARSTHWVAQRQSPAHWSLPSSPYLALWLLSGERWLGCLCPSSAPGLHSPLTQLLPLPSQPHKESWTGEPEPRDHPGSRILARAPCIPPS